MLFSEIAKEIQKDYTLEYGINGSDEDVFEIFPLSDAIEENDSCIYVVNALCTDNSCANVHTLLLPVSKMTERIRREKNYMAVRDEVIDTVYSRISYLLCVDNKIKTVQLQLIRDLIAGKGFGNTLEKLSEQLSTAIVILDQTGKILASSNVRRLGHSGWIESTNQGYCPTSFMEHLTQLRTENTHTMNDRPKIRQCPDSGLYYLYKHIYVSGTFYGYIFMLSRTGNFTLFGHHVTEYLSEAMTRFAVLNRLPVNGGNAAIHGLLPDLIRGISEDEARSRILSSGIQTPERMILLAVKPINTLNPSYISDSLVPQLQKRLPEKAVILSYQGNAVVFMENTQSSGLLEPSVMQQLTELTQKEPVRVGISNVFREITRCSRYYLQAQSALRFGSQLWETSPVIYYKDVVIQDAAEKIGAEEVRDYCHPALDILRTYDNETGSRLYDTLKCYAENGFNHNKTAADMKLHRNSLAYRKEKIEALTGLDLEDIHTMVILYNSFEVYNYLDSLRV